MMKQPETSSIARKFENLSNIFYLMVGVPLVIFGWIYLNLKNIEKWGLFATPYTAAVLNAVIIVVALALAFRAYRKYKGQLANPGLPAEQAAGRQQVIEKANFFAVVSLQFYWSLTISTILVVIGFYLSAEEFYIILYSILLVLFSINRPTLDGLIKGMKLKKEEQELLFEAWKTPGV